MLPTRAHWRTAKRFSRGRGSRATFAGVREDNHCFDRQRFSFAMKIGHPVKKRVRVGEQPGCFCVYADEQPIIRTCRLRDARRMAVVLRRSLADPARFLVVS
jgi:hypothetical protein